MSNLHKVVKQGGDGLFEIECVECHAFLTAYETKAEVAAEARWLGWITRINKYRNRDGGDERLAFCSKQCYKESMHSPDYDPFEFQVG